MKTLNRKNVLISSLFLGCLGLGAHVTPANAREFKVVSEVLKPHKKMSEKQVFNGFGCKGENISPDLRWTGAPEGTRYFAVTLFDPDAPTGSGWWHWVVLNIPKTVDHLPLGASNSDSPALPLGAIETRTDFGKAGYGGPCPPVGNKSHRYIFTVYALKDVVPLDKEAPGAMAGFYLNQLKLGEAKLEVNYGR